MVNCPPDFGHQPEVINGCSDLLVEVFGDAGRHARSAVGMGSLPRGMAVEIELVVEVVRLPNGRRRTALRRRSPRTPRRAAARRTSARSSPRGAATRRAGPARPWPGPTGRTPRPAAASAPAGPLGVVDQQQPEVRHRSLDDPHRAAAAEPAEVVAEPAGVGPQRGMGGGDPGPVGQRGDDRRDLQRGDGPRAAPHAQQLPEPAEGDQATPTRAPASPKNFEGERRTTTLPGTLSGRPSRSHRGGRWRRPGRARTRRRTRRRPAHPRGRRGPQPAARGGRGSDRRGCGGSRGGPPDRRASCSAISSMGWWTPGGPTPAPGNACWYSV